MTPKSLRGERTQEQFDFDWGVKGWAFTTPGKLSNVLTRAQLLYNAIGFEDKERFQTLMAILQAAQEHQP